MFANRRSAGRQLSARLQHLREEKPVVLALPSGGVPVGFEIAQSLDAPLDIVLVRKIGVPWQPELALGAVVNGANPQTIINRNSPPSSPLTRCGYRKSYPGWRRCRDGLSSLWDA
jgi:putative phosphoribosyl transferase